MQLAMDLIKHVATSLLDIIICTMYIQQVRVPFYACITDKANILVEGDLAKVHEQQSG